jgi:hypothetical protein
MVEIEMNGLQASNNTADIQAGAAAPAFGVYGDAGGASGVLFRLWTAGQPDIVYVFNGGYSTSSLALTIDINAVEKIGGKGREQ